MDAEPQATRVALPVSADQRAVLELVLKHGVDYETIGAVLSAGTDGARARARAALSAITRSETEIDDALADFMLGRASAAEQVRIVRSLAEDPQANALASQIGARLRAEFGEVEVPEIPPLHERASVQPAAGATPASDGRGEEPRRRLRVAFRLTALVVMAAVAGLLVVAGLPGGSDPSDDGQASAIDVEDRIPLSPRIGDGRGEAVIGFTTETEPYLDLFVNGIDGLPENRVAILWMDVDGESGIPLSPSLSIKPDGSNYHRFELPLDVIAALDQARSIDVIAIRAKTLPKLRSEFPSALIESDPLANAARLPDPYAQTLLSGPVPALESAQTLN